MDKRTVNRLIYLGFADPTRVTQSGYVVRTGGYADCEDYVVRSIEVGHAIVRALRKVAYRKPQRFPLHTFNLATQVKLVTRR